MKLPTPIGDFDLRLQSATAGFCDGLFTQYLTSLNLEKVDGQWRVIAGSMLLTRDSRKPSSKAATRHIPAAILVAVTKAEQEHPEVFVTAQREYLTTHLEVYGEELERARNDLANLQQLVAGHEARIAEWQTQLDALSNGRVAK